LRAVAVLEARDLSSVFSLVALRVIAVIVAFGALLQLLPSTEFWHGAIPMRSPR